MRTYSRCLAHFAIPTFRRQLIKLKRGVKTREMKRARTSVTAEEMTFAAACLAIVVVWLGKQGFLIESIEKTASTG